jgi:hypothetical protein
MNFEIFGTSPIIAAVVQVFSNGKHRLLCARVQALHDVDRVCTSDAVEPGRVLKEGCVAVVMGGIALRCSQDDRKRLRRSTPVSLICQYRSKFSYSPT